MINAIQQQLHTPAATSAASTSAAAPPSTGFDDELAQASYPDIRSVFDSPATTNSAAPAVPAQPSADTTVPTAQSVFGDQPWVQNPQGSGPENSTWNYNPIYFASEATAEKVASMVGGTVIQQEAMTPAPGSPLQQSQPNEMVQLKDGTVVNPGLIADFYDHGYSQSFVDQMVQNEIQGV